ncbi:MAG: hypothetical protein ACE5EL_00065 [Anaerolineae bacterium]
MTAPRWREAVFCAAIVLGALALRWPGLQEIPRLTDETGEVAAALAILEGDRPLVHNDAYRGPGWAYLLAATLRVVGVAPGVPRAFAAVLGAMTAGAAFAMAAALAGSNRGAARAVASPETRLEPSSVATSTARGASARWMVPGAGLVAGAGVATATGLVVLSSHVAWSNNATPLAVVVAAIALHRGVQVAPRGSWRSRAWLTASGALWGLAIQTHPSALAPLAGAGLWYLVAAGSAGLRRPGTWLAVAAFGAAVGPLVVFNLQRPLASLGAATAADQPMARDHSPGAIATNTVALFGQVGRMAGAGPGDRLGPEAAAAAVPGTAEVVYAGVLVLALALSLVTGPRLVGAMAGASVLILPLVNRSYDNFYDGRYVAILVVLGWVAVGTASATLWRRWGGSHGRLYRAALVAVLAATIAYPVVPTARLYARERGAGRTNAPFLEDAALVAHRAAGDPATTVLVDKALRDIGLGGGGNAQRAFTYLLALQGVPAAQADVSEMRWHLARRPRGPLVLVVAQATAPELAARGAITMETRPDWRVMAAPAHADRPGKP